MVNVYEPNDEPADIQDGGWEHPAQDDLGSMTVKQGVIQDLVNEQKRANRPTHVYDYEMVYYNGTFHATTMHEAVKMLEADLLEKTGRPYRATDFTQVKYDRFTAGSYSKCAVSLQANIIGRGSFKEIIYDDLPPLKREPVDPNDPKFWSVF